MVEELAHQETHYVWAGPEEPENLKAWILAVSSEVEPFHKDGVMAIVKEHAAHRYRVVDRSGHKKLIA